MILVADQLVHAFQGRTVLSGLSLEVGAGEVVGLLGPNGAGKSTALRIVAGLLRPTSGNVTLHGKSINSLPLWVRVRRGLGYLPQEASVLRDLSVEDNLLLAARTSVDPVASVRTIMDDRGLAAVASVRAGDLSGGERRRMEIARALASRPAVLVMDEPFSGIDPVGIESLQRSIRELADTGIGVLITDHSVRATLNVCDRAVILDAGSVMADGCPDTIVQSQVVRDRYLGNSFQV